MSKSKLGFLKHIDEVVQRRNQQLNKISNEISTYKNLIGEKKGYIANLKKEFDETLDTNIVSEIDKLNVSITDMENKIKLLEQPFKSDIKVKSEKDVTEELEGVFEELFLSEIKDSIFKNQEAYINSLEKYYEKISFLSNLKNEFEKKQNNIHLDTLKIINKWFESTAARVHLSIKLISNEYAANEQKLLLWINSLADRL